MTDFASTHMTPEQAHQSYLTNQAPESNDRQISDAPSVFEIQTYHGWQRMSDADIVSALLRYGYTVRVLKESN